MKRNSYVDSEGNTIDQKFESKKTLLKIFFVFGTVIPIVLLIIIIWTMISNKICLNVYNNIEKAAYKYAKAAKKLPTIEGENIKVNIKDLYNGYLDISTTKKQKCTGTVKITRYKDDYIYTLGVENCKSCSISKRYGKYSSYQDNYPTSKAIVDVTPYYNYYDRQLNTTKWSEYFTDSELQKKVSKYGVRLPKEDEDSDESLMPEVPEGASIYSVIKEEKTEYRYKDASWKWYDITGDYSDYYSKQPDGYEFKDEETEITTEWSDYSLNYPSEASYREIQSATGRRYYYEKNGKKIYANNGNYIPEDKVNTEKYDQYDEEEKEIYTYCDHKWRWYNGTKRNYSNYESTKPDGYNFKDEQLIDKGSYTDWQDESTLNSQNVEYRKEQSRTLVRYAYEYEFISEAYLDKPVTKKEFTQIVGTSVPEFSKLRNYKLEVTYKFKYRKKWFNKYMFT